MKRSSKKHKKDPKKVEEIPEDSEQADYIERIRIENMKLRYFPVLLFISYNFKILQLKL